MVCGPKEEVIMRKEKPENPGKKRIMIKQATAVLLAVCLAMNYWEQKNDL
jgi:hypothetical protein